MLEFIYIWISLPFKNIKVRVNLYIVIHVMHMSARAKLCLFACLHTDRSTFPQSFESIYAISTRGLSSLHH